MSVRPDVGLERLIHGLEQELLAAPDEEFVAGARDLGMKPEMKGSAAFLGIKKHSAQLLAALRKAEASDADAEAEAAAPEHTGTPKRNVDA